MSKSKSSGPQKSEEEIQKSLDEMEYSGKDDIYSRDKEEDLDLDEGRGKRPKAKKDDGNDLDVPGAELDDDDEAIGEEDEENNYYSLGGDDHDDLEETNDDNV
jgi:hypothetical protein